MVGSSSSKIGREKRSKSKYVMLQMKTGRMKRTKFQVFMNINGRVFRVILSSMKTVNEPNGWDKFARKEWDL